MPPPGKLPKQTATAGLVTSVCATNPSLPAMLGEVQHNRPARP